MPSREEVVMPTKEDRCAEAQPTSTFDKPLFAFEDKDGKRAPVEKFVEGGVEYYVVTFECPPELRKK